MSHNYIVSFFAFLFFIIGNARSSTSKLEISVGGNSIEFPPPSLGFLIVDTAGDGFDFATSNTILENKSNSEGGDKWGDDDVVVLAHLQSTEFPELGRGFDIETELNPSPADEKWKSGDKLALVWFPNGLSGKGSPYSYYTSEEIEDDAGTNAFTMPEDGATDSIVYTGVVPVAKGQISGGTSTNIVISSQPSISAAPGGTASAKKPTAKKPSAKKPSAKKPSAKKSSGKKPPAKKSSPK